MTLQTGPSQDDYINCVDMNLFMLSQFQEEFKIAIDLFELLERGGNPQNGVFGGVFVQYRIVAARDGALGLYHFRCSMDGVFNNAERAYNIPRKAPKFLAIMSEFDNKFPNVGLVRHAIAHAGELYESPRKSRRGTMTTSQSWHGGSAGPGGQLKHGLYEKTYTVGKDGKAFSVILDYNSYAHLQKVRSEVAIALEELIEASKTGKSDEPA